MRFSVSGMSCAACSARVEKAVLQVTDVVSCNVSLLTNQMTVEGSANPDAIIEAVRAAGYDAVEIQNDSTFSSVSPDKTDDQTGFLLRKLLFSLCFMIPLMLLSMGGVMLEWPVFGFFRSKPLALCLCEMVLCLAVLVIHREFFINGFKGLFRGSPNMDTLVSVGSLASFLYSMAIAVTIIKYQSASQIEVGWQNLHHLYFDSSAMILVLITVGKILEARSKGKTTEALSSLLKMAPKTARLIKNEKEIIVPVSELQVGDCFAVKPGDSIPTDGEVISGESSVNESYLTGESMPVEKAAGSPVFSATLNTNGYMQCRVTKTGDETTHAQIIKLISDAAATKAPAARIADRVAAVFVPVVMIIALITATIWMLITRSFNDALLRGVSVLVVSCPCALGLATPVAIMVGNGVGAKNGILFKTAAALENLGKAQIVVLDKTGTITAGKPYVKELFPYNGCTETELLAIAASMEQGSEHPLAKAVLAEAEKRNIQRKAVDAFEARSGYGVIGIIDGKPAYVGKQSFVLSMMEIHELPQQLLQKSASDDLTQIWIGMDHEVLGFITVEDLVKPDSRQAVAEMGRLCERVIMLSGDRKDTAQRVADQIGLKEFIPEVLPGQKEETIRRLKEDRVVLMVGDGLNDAPALMRADIGCAIGNGTNVAIEAADVVLMNNRLTDVCAGIRLSRATLRVIRQNLFWALCYNLIGIPLAAGAFIPILHWELQPMFCAAMMSLSSIIVVSNALRINRFALFDPKSDKKIISKKKGRREMEKTFKTEGMMCCHCENHVKKALLAIDGVTEVAANHETGLVTIFMNTAVADDTLKAAIEGEGYKVLGKA